MKKIKYIFAVLGLSLALTGCEHALSETSVMEPLETASNKKSITISGTINSSGATSRTATSSFDGDITWIITASSTDNPGKTASGRSVSRNFTLECPVAGTWSISVSGYPGYHPDGSVGSTNAIFYGTQANITVTEDGLESPLQITATLLQPLTALTSGVDGSISLDISSESTDVKTVKAKLKAYPSGTETIQASASFSDGETTLSIDDIAPGSYVARLFFEDEPGNNLYACTEMINVYPGMETNLWYGEAPYFVTSEGETNFVLTSDILSTYHSERVNSSNYIFYNAASGAFGTNYQFYHVPALTSSIDIETPTLTSEGTSGNVWKYGGKTFDSEGHIYTLFYKTISENGYKIYKDGELIADSANAPSNSKYYESISCDTVTDTFYLGCYTSSQFIFKVEKDDLTVTNLSSNLTGITPSIGSSGKPYKFAVHDGIIYYAHNSATQSAKPKLLKIDYSTGTESTIKALDFDSNVCINEVLYQDGNVYILISESPSQLNSTNTKLNSRGGVLKYNILTNTLDSTTLGWSSTEQNRTNKWFQIAWFSNGDIQDLLYTSENRIGKVLGKADDPALSEFSIYSPETPLSQLSSTGFYGPKAFVAIKPKKLVILDEGIAFYTDAEGVYKYKNVNRIVTVDLDDFSISETSNVPSSITFNEDDTGLKPNVCGFCWEGVLYDEDKAVIFDASDGTSTINLHSFGRWNQDPENVTLDASAANWYTATLMGIPLGTD